MKRPVDPLDMFAKIDRWFVDAAVYGSAAIVLATMMLLTLAAVATVVAFGMRLALR